MKLTKVLSLICATLMLAACFSGCFGGGGTSSDITSNQPSSPSDWELNVSSDPNADKEGTEDFDNNSGVSSIPGESDDDEGDGDDFGDSDENYDPFAEPSVFENLEDFKYKYQTKNYIYGITNEGYERIAFINPDGSYTDALAGTGSYVLNADVIGQVAAARDVKSYERTLIDNRMALIVTFEGLGMEAHNSIFKSTYVFYDNYIKVSANVSYNSNYTILKSASVNMTYLGGVSTSKVQKKYDFNWYYPEDGGFPYRETFSFMNKNVLPDGKHSVYVFNTGNIPEYYFDMLVRYPGQNVPVFLDTTEPVYSVNYTAEYTIVFAHEKEDNTENNYRARFYSRNSDYAAGIAPVEANDDVSSIFRRDEVELNMNVTNLTQQDVNFSVRYELYDFYGNLVDKGIHVNSTVFAGLEANRTVKVSAKEHGYGMFFLNLLVVSDKYTYREYYPFIMLDDYEYKYYANNPFGMNQIVEPDLHDLEDVYSIFCKIGISSVRGGFTFTKTDKQIEQCTRILEDIKQKGFHYTEHGGWDAKRDQYYGKYITEFIDGNEYNMKINGGEYSVNDANLVWNMYYEEEVAPQLAIAAKYNKIPILAGNSAGADYWFDEIYKAGLWKPSVKQSIHSYSLYRNSPDLKSQYYALWGAEAGFARTQRACEKYGDISWQIHETGYSCIPESDNVCIRTAADYNIRCYLLGVGCGAETVSLYCLFDYQTGGFGTEVGGTEFHFGQFYLADYYGRILPKPTVMAFATMTRILESYKGCVESEKYSNFNQQNMNGGGTKRVFAVDTEVNGTVFVAWSNNYLLPNDRGYERVPICPWDGEKLWGDHTEDLVVDVIGDSITVVTLGGKDTVIPAVNGKATVKLTGAPVFILGAK